jgi:purine-nucleoside/S-methyl-5'-thioadenosine phosphorylase / adenosine deaminase
VGPGAQPPALQLEGVEPIAELATLGIVAFTTTRERGSFNLAGDEPAHAVVDRWTRLVDDVRPMAPRLAMARQVHGDTVRVHGAGWEGWLRAADADAHCAPGSATALAVTLADCVPVFLAHSSGAVALAHSGWKGTVLGVAVRAVEVLEQCGIPAAEIVAHCGPAICGGCYEVGPDVHRRLTGRPVTAPARVDLRQIIAAQLRARGVREVSLSPWCTRCHNERFYSHRAGDAGRQLGVIVGRGG